MWIYSFHLNMCAKPLKDHAPASSLQCPDERIDRVKTNGHREE
jgi:hypothetical protein